MYLSLGIFLLLLLLYSITLFTFRKRKCVRKVCTLSHTQKCELLNSLLSPFGYLYDATQDCISTHKDAWQRSASYTAHFDHAASFLSMVFDCLPVYFSYDGRTWLIEFWKGQYGINTGAEVGIYYADHIVPKSDLSRTLFQAVDDDDMLSLSFTLSRKDSCYARMAKRTWWLTAFLPGCFSRPECLTLAASVVFPDCDMMHGFLKGLSDTGFPMHLVKCCGTSLQICFREPLPSRTSFFYRLRRKWAQFWNRFFCFLYRRITRVFCLTLDRLLYLYFLLPFFFRKLLHLRRHSS